MMRIILFLLVLLLTAGCRSAAPLANEGPAATDAPALSPASAAPAATDAPLAEEALPALRSLLRYEFTDLSAGQMFSFDLDQDGVEESFSFALRPDDEWATVISMDRDTIILEDGDEPIRAEIVDLDPESPFYNLLIVLDYGSDSYGTVELHPENGRLVRGKSIFGDYRIADDGLRFSERTDLLGTNFGYRTYHGDELISDSVWFDMKPPTEEELKGDLTDLIDFGTVIHCAKPVPCVIDGQATTLPAGTCFYGLRFMDPEVDLVMEVRTLEGVVAQLFFYDDEDEPHDPYRIYDSEQDEYFDNLLWAD